MAICSVGLATATWRDLQLRKHMLRQPMSRDQDGGDIADDMIKLPLNHFLKVH